eukprot:324633-Pleurochrysis_carterae.AAC.1
MLVSIALATPQARGTPSSSTTHASESTRCRALASAESFADFVPVESATSVVVRKKHPRVSSSHRRGSSILPATRCVRR